MQSVYNLYAICMQSVCNLYAICMQSVCNLYTICMQSVCNLYIIFMESLWNLLEKESAEKQGGSHEGGRAANSTFDYALEYERNNNKKINNNN